MEPRKNTIRKLLIVACGLGLLASPVFAATEISVYVGQGCFVFKDMQFMWYQNPPALAGQFQNCTGQEWGHVEFEVPVYAETGERILNSGKLTFDHVKIGMVKSFEYSFSIPSGYNQIISGYDILFHTRQEPSRYAVKMVKPRLSKSLCFEDKYCKVQFYVSGKDLSMVFENRSNTPIAIDWNKTFFVDVLRNAYRVVHAGVPGINRFQTPTIVLPNAKISDRLSPVTQMQDMNTRQKEWRRIPIMPSVPDDSFYKGKSFRLVLPLVKDRRAKEYLFSFLVDPTLSQVASAKVRSNAIPE